MLDITIPNYEEPVANYPEILSNDIIIPNNIELLEPVVANAEEALAENNQKPLEVFCLQQHFLRKNNLNYY